MNQFFKQICIFYFCSKINYYLPKIKCMEKFLLIPLLFLSYISVAQSVGIGTNSPVSSSVLDMGPSAKPMVLPRLTSAQMNAVSPAALGMMVFNTDEQQIYSYMKYRVNIININRWQPISTGPRMLAWGIVDSFATTITGGNTHSVTWDATNNWYRLQLSNPFEYYKDSMLLMITPVGNGSWDQVVSTGELIESSSRLASVKFTDVSRSVDGFSAVDRRRRSGFHFVLYDLRKVPY